MKQEWYQNFMSDENLGGAENFNVLFGMTAAANFMGIKQLLDLCCLKFTFRACGKSEEELRIIFKLPKLTPEERAQAKKDHPWLFENAK